VARQFSIGTKFGSEKGKVQKPARIPPQTPPAGGKKAEAGQFHSPRKINSLPRRVQISFQGFPQKMFELRPENTANFYIQRKMLSELKIASANSVPSGAVFARLAALD
jgi:hypothetical protein